MLLYGGVRPSEDDIIADPLYQIPSIGDFRLDTASPGYGAASDNTDMGAWGGTGTFSLPTGCTSGTNCLVDSANVYMDW
jgi:hypothetical protein